MGLSKKEIAEYLADVKRRESEPDHIRSRYHRTETRQYWFGKNVFLNSLVEREIPKAFQDEARLLPNILKGTNDNS